MLEGTVKLSKAHKVDALDPMMHLEGIGLILIRHILCLVKVTGPLGDKVSSIYLQSFTASFPSLVASKV